MDGFNRRFSLLIIDGVRFDEHHFDDEGEFEDIVEKHVKDIFGPESVYFGKKRIKSASGTVSIPDGYAICFQDSPVWYVVEIELGSHSREHIAGQLTKFVNGIENDKARRDLVDFMETELSKDPEQEARIRKRFGEVYRFLSNTINKTPYTNLIIADYKSIAIEEVASAIKQTRILEFSVMEREGIGLGVNAVMFEPIYSIQSSKQTAGLVHKAGNITPQGAYAIPLLESLIEMGGAGKVKDVLDRIGEKMKGQLRDVDLEKISTGAVRWRNHAMWERLNLIDLGYLKRDSLRGIWEVTDKGREYYEKNRS